MCGLVAATFSNDPEASELVDQAILSAPALGMDGTLLLSFTMKEIR